MGKKTGADRKFQAAVQDVKASEKSKAAACPQSPADGAATAPAAPLEPQTWLDELSPEARELEEAKRAERQKKAEEAAWKTQKQNERRLQWEKEAQKQTRVKEREDKKWNQQLGKSKERAFKEGVLEAEVWGDQWFVDLGNKTWKETSGEFYCPHCDKHLSTHTLDAHIDSEGHRKKLAYLTNLAPGALPVYTAPQTQSTPMPTPPAAATATRGGNGLEPWQERSPDGFVRCVPCYKVLDALHVQTDEHKKRLGWWYEAQQPQDYSAPELPYLAWVPDENNPEKRWLRCLLCNKNVQDNWSHFGTPEAPNGSKDHEKKLRNYSWYQEDIEKLRNQWHPPAPRPRAAAQSATPAPWAKAAPAPEDDELIEC
mmetsp:Transcript_20639/g.57501  ORF Transcript_20639/g.57501 Transcript_20639/m.57501 type:complete len:370 (+) Transcript_20639:99-1208(+)|eukprot:CAMPEP_0117498194 /NCGR_PEP_ID=MMETSP0784-20121206/21585_1 /TAXON_ID=39447 /ORGANISM="" /LENGTH=369 /DNA_ID=CAMNT_0005293265 /DNA_START=52 /DNA_END=1161 /DNA_ORIENTATION=+